MWKRLSVTVLFIFSTLAAAAEMQIHTIPLQHQPPENLSATLTPLIPEGGYLTSHGNNIIVRTTSENLAELQLLIEELDKPLAQLMISVRRGSQFEQSNSQIKVNGKYTTDNGGIVIGDGDNNTKTTITTRRTTGSISGNNNYQVRGIEGRPSYIQAGNEVPITTYQTGAYGRPSINQEYKSVNRGFYATPRLYGDRVNIDISAQHDTVDDSHSKSTNTRINTESVNTSVSGRLGEWIAIGSINNNRSDKNTGLTNYRSTDSLSSNTIYLKVERVR